MVGKVVCSTSGRDKGKLMVIVSSGEHTAFVCDGKERPLENPKRKNLKHISFTGYNLETKQFETNRALRKALAVLRDTCYERVE